MSEITYCGSIAEGRWSGVIQEERGPKVNYTERDIRRTALRLLQRLKPLDKTPGYRMETYPLRDALLNVSSGYPELNTTEFGELLEAIEGILPLLEPQKSVKLNP